MFVLAQKTSPYPGSIKIDENDEEEEEEHLEGNDELQPSAEPRGNAHPNWKVIPVMNFMCSLCGQSFRHKSSLLRHQITGHGRQKKKRGCQNIVSSNL